MKKLELSENLNYHIFPQAQKLRHLYRVYGWGFRLVYWVMCNCVRLRIRQTKTKQKRINLLGLGSIYRVQHDCKFFFVCSFREEMRPKKENKRWNCAKNQFFLCGNDSNLFFIRTWTYARAQWITSQYQLQFTCEFVSRLSSIRLSSDKSPSCVILGRNSSITRYVLRRAAFQCFGHVR